MAKKRKLVKRTWAIEIVSKGTESFFHERCGTVELFETRDEARDEAACTAVPGTRWQPISVEVRKV